MLMNKNKCDRQLAKNMKKLSVMEEADNYWRNTEEGRWQWYIAQELRY